MFPVSDQFMEAMDVSHIAVRKVEVRNSGNFIADMTKYVTAGSVTVDETRQVRRTCSLTLSVPYDYLPAGTLSATGVPLTDQMANLFHPTTGNELYLYRGVKYPSATTLTFSGVANGQIVESEFAQLGVFRMTKPVVTDDGENVTIVLTGQDRSSVISRISWQEPYSIPVGTNLGSAIQAGMASRVANTPLSSITYNIAPTSYVVPATIWGANPGTSTNDPMADMIKLASVGGYELFFDVYGNVVMRQIISPTNNPVVDTFTEGISLTSTSIESSGSFNIPVADAFSDIGVGYCRMLQVERTLDETKTYNGVIVYCNGVGSVPPFAQAVWDNDPTSPTYYQGPWGPVPFAIVTTSIPAPGQSMPNAVAQATAMAIAQLQLILGAFDETSFECVPNPALWEGDSIQLVRTRIKINDTYVCSSMTIPLDVQSAQQISNRPLFDAGLITS